MSELTIAAIIAAIPPTLMALLTYIKTQEIHTLANSNYAALDKKYELALEEMRGLKAMVASMDKAKDVADRVAAKKLDEQK